MSPSRKIAVSFVGWWLLGKLWCVCVLCLCVLYKKSALYSGEQKCCRSQRISWTNSNSNSSSENRSTVSETVIIGE